MGTLARHPKPFKQVVPALSFADELEGEIVHSKCLHLVITAYGSYRSRAAVKELDEERDAVIKLPGFDVRHVSL